MVGGEEVSEIWGCQLLESFVGGNQGFIVDAVGDGKPVEVF